MSSFLLCCWHFVYSFAHFSRVRSHRSLFFCLQRSPCLLRWRYTWLKAPFHRWWDLKCPVLTCGSQKVSFCFTLSPSCFPQSVAPTAAIHHCLENTFNLSFSISPPNSHMGIVDRFLLFTYVCVCVCVFVTLQLKMWPSVLSFLFLPPPS